jgi:NAD(P)-dependent dehydrogenase (short-subunit alcohol dehydrogenase family)
VHVTSRPGLEPAAGMATSAVSKAVLVHLTRVLGLELRPLGIRLNAVAPQILDTAKNRQYLTPDGVVLFDAPRRSGTTCSAPSTRSPPATGCRTR